MALNETIHCLNNKEFSYALAHLNSKVWASLVLTNRCALAIILHYYRIKLCKLQWVIGDRLSVKRKTMTNLEQIFCIR